MHSVPQPPTQPIGNAIAMRLSRAPAGAWQFAITTTLSALLALAAAIVLGVVHPWWAAMTAWLVAQPTRGLLIERSLARLAGGGVGAAVGYGLLVAYPGQSWELLTALTVWIGLCCGAGALFRHFRNYGFVVAGWTAGIVTLFGLGDTSHQAALALGRVSSTALGILAVAVMTAALIPANRGQQVASRLRGLVDKTVTWVTENAASLHQPRGSGEIPKLLAEIGALEPAIDEAAAGSLRGRAAAGMQRVTLAALINLLAIGRKVRATSPRSAAHVPGGQRTQEATQNLVSETTTSETLSSRLLVLGSAFANQPTWVATCATLARAMSGVTDAEHPPRTREWRDSVVASIRAMLTVVLASIVWWLTGWNQGPVLVMTAALFACLFSGNDHATTAVNDVLKGSLCGALLGIACRLWVWPWAVTPALQLLSITPFLFLGAYLMARPKTAKMAIDLNMTFLLVTRPGFEHPITGSTVVLQALAILGGVLIALTVFHLVMPASRNAKLASVVRRMAGRLDRIAKRVDRIAIDDLRPLTADVLRMATLGNPSHHGSVALQEQALEALGEASALADANTEQQHHPCRDSSPGAQRLVGYAAALREAAQVLSSPARPWRNT